MATLKRAGALAFLLLGCGVHLDPGHKSSPEVSSAATFIEGKVEISDGQRQDLAQLRDKPVVVIFSQDTCVVCAAEARALRLNLQDPQRAPTKIYLKTFLLGAIKEDALDWKELYKIPWDVGYLTDLSVYRKYCPAGTVPCVLVQMPEKGLVFQSYGKVSFADLEKITGPWE